MSEWVYGVDDVNIYILCIQFSISRRFVNSNSAYIYMYSGDIRYFMSMHSILPIILNWLLHTIYI